MLVFEGDGPGDRESLSFRALSLESALEVAKKSAVGEWAELHEDGQPVCRMQLIDASGVWRVSRAGSRS
ncbi:hypothetical protein WAB17_01345 [Parerythrobacter aurantius]|uniref:hypothetical protein n=1 Tax=Parerythrobacter aurantius TaxID=3127706 RepID=UPI003250B41A